MGSRRTASASSKPVVRARKLSRRSVRSELGLFLAEGPQAVREAVAAGAAVELFATADGAERHPQIVAAALQAECDVFDVDDKTLASVSDTVTPQGLIAVAKMPRGDLETAITSESKLVVVLVQAQDPGNAGTIIRIADAAGADALVLTSGSVDPFNSKSVRASAGSVFHLPIVAGVSVDDVLVRIDACALQTLAATGHATASLFDDSVTARLAAPSAWLFGNEARGLPEDVAAEAALQVRIPIFGAAESLNLGSAVSICLYASASAQRR